MYDQLALDLESVSNTNLGQNLKRAKNKDIYQSDLKFVKDQYVLQLLNIEWPTCLRVYFKYVLHSYQVYYLE